MEQLRVSSFAQVGQEERHLAGRGLCWLGQRWAGHGHSPASPSGSIAEWRNLFNACTWPAGPCRRTSSSMGLLPSRSPILAVLRTTLSVVSADVAAQGLGSATCMARHRTLPGTGLSAPRSTANWSQDRGRAPECGTTPGGLCARWHDWWRTVRTGHRWPSRRADAAPVREGSGPRLPDKATCRQECCLLPACCRSLPAVGAASGGRGAGRATRRMGRSPHLGGVFSDLDHVLFQPVTIRNMSSAGNRGMSSDVHYG